MHLQKTRIELCCTCAILVLFQVSLMISDFIAIEDRLKIVSWRNTATGALRRHVELLASCRRAIAAFAEVPSPSTS
jgi:hypothetical protein